MTSVIWKALEAHKMANRVAVITMGVKLGHETKGYTRFLSVCQALRAAGFDVDL